MDELPFTELVNESSKLSAGTGNWTRRWAEIGRIQKRVSGRDRGQSGRGSTRSLGFFSTSLRLVSGRSENKDTSKVRRRAACPDAFLAQGVTTSWSPRPGSCFLPPLIPHPRGASPPLSPLPLRPSSFPPFLKPPSWSPSCSLPT